MSERSLSESIPFWNDWIIPTPKKEEPVDPDLLLEYLRANVRIIVAFAEIDDPNDRERNEILNQGVSMAESFDALDKWIAKGGFLPNSWGRMR